MPIVNSNHKFKNVKLKCVFLPVKSISITQLNLSRNMLTKMKQMIVNRNIKFGCMHESVMVLYTNKPASLL